MWTQRSDCAASTSRVQLWQQLTQKLTVEKVDILPHANLCNITLNKNNKSNKIIASPFSSACGSSSLVSSQYFEELLLDLHSCDMTKNNNQNCFLVFIYKNGDFNNTALQNCDSLLSSAQRSTQRLQAGPCWPSSESLHPAPPPQSPLPPLHHHLRL